jgi:hypothetical protein
MREETNGKSSHLFLGRNARHELCSLFVTVLLFLLFLSLFLLILLLLLQFSAAEKRKNSVYLGYLSYNAEVSAKQINFFVYG